MEDEIIAPATAERKKPNILFRTVQWLVVLWCLFVALLHAMPISHLDLPGAPVLLFAASMAASISMIVLHLPTVFFRLPKMAKIAAYLGLLVSFCLVVATSAEVSDLYDRTPAGAREKADREERERIDAKERAEAAKAEKASEVQAEAIRAESDKQTRAKAACEALVSQVQAMAQQQRGIEIIELNDLSAFDTGNPQKPLSCTAKATTTRGDLGLSFGLEQTPQGKPLVTMQFSD